MSLPSPLAAAESVASALPNNPWPQPKSLAPVQWALVGPFPNPLSPDGKRVGLEVDYVGGEATCRLVPGTSVLYDGVEYPTRVVRADARGSMDLERIYEGDTDYKCAYAYSEWRSLKGGYTTVYFGSDDGAKVWVNGRLVHEMPTDRGLEPDSDRFEIELLPGINQILVKVENATGGWGFAIRAFDQRGMRALEILGRRRTLEQLEIGPEAGPYFLGDRFPMLVFRQPEAAKAIFRSTEIKPIWFGPDGGPVTEPKHPGRYVALVALTTRDGFQHRRMVPFFKLAPGVDPTFLAPPFRSGPELNVPREGFWRWPALHEGARREINDHLWAALMNSLASSAHGAIIAAGLSERAVNSGSPDWVDSGFIRQAEYELRIRMRLEGRTPSSLARPVELMQAAPELREGTEVEAAMEPGTVERLREVCQAWAQEDPNGFVVLVARNGVTFMHEGFNGFRPETTFFPASIGKVLSGFTFARAVDQGLVGFDEPLKKLMPAWSGGAFDHVTYRHCFCHLTGLTGHLSHGGLYNAFLDEALFAQDAIFSVPSSNFRYNGDGYNIAAKALELLTGKCFWRLVEESFRAPLDEAVTQYDAGIGDLMTVRFLGKLSQMLLQDGAYGKYRFFRPGFVQNLFPQRIADFIPSAVDPHLEWGVGLTWLPENAPEAAEPEWVSPMMGHGSASGCVWRIATQERVVVAIGRNACADTHRNADWRLKFLRVLKQGLR